MITSLVTSASGGEGAATFRGRPGFPVLIFRGRPRFFFLGAGSAGAAVASCFTGSKPFSGDLRSEKGPLSLLCGTDAVATLSPCTHETRRLSCGRVDGVEGSHADAVDAT